MSSSYVGASTPEERLAWQEHAGECLRDSSTLPSKRCWIERTLFLIHDIEDLTDPDGDEERKLMGEHLCGTCQFHCDRAPNEFTDIPAGECRKYAPDAAYGWPKAPSDGWCGEWEEREDTSVDPEEDWPLGRI